MAGENLRPTKKTARVRAIWRDFVLDVGSGGHPHSSADILVERYLDDMLHHRGGRPLIRDRPLVMADVAALPFRGESFDYVICNQVIEHVQDPASAIDDLCRVGKRGYLSVPSEFAEFICTHPNHLWVFALKDNRALIKRKLPKHEYATSHLFGGLSWMLHHVPDYKALMLKYPRLLWVNLEWEDSIAYSELPADSQFYDYHDPASVTPLLEVSCPESVTDFLKRWLFTRLDLAQLSFLAHVRKTLRGLLGALLGKR